MNEIIEREWGVPVSERERMAEDAAEQRLELLLPLPLPDASVRYGWNPSVRAESCEEVGDE